MRYFIDLAYNGKAYFGWQKQPRVVSVQEVLEKALSTAFQQPLEVVGAGRTDSGVHAQQLFAHFDTEKKFDINQLIFKLNTLLPNDIAINDLFEVKKDAHARFDAVSREYKYYISTKKNPFATDYSYYIKKKLDDNLMNKAAGILLEYTDFKCFSKVKTDVKTYNCKIEKAYWEKLGDQLIFTIQADRFLRNMVRAIVGTLIDVGLGKISLEDVRLIVESRNRSNAGKSVNAEGLFLTRIEYPQSIRK